MPTKRLFTIVTMMLLTATKVGAQQRVTIAELRIIESLIGQQDCGQLYRFLTSNPHTLAGSDPLARELQVFVRDVETGRLDCFAAAASDQDSLVQSASGVASEQRLY